MDVVVVAPDFVAFDRMLAAAAAADLTAPLRLFGNCG
jgi:hypothetical protein